MKRNDYAVSLVKSMVLTCCALHNLCESHGEVYENAWDLPPAAETVVVVPQAAEEEGRSRKFCKVNYQSNFCTKFQSVQCIPCFFIYVLACIIMALIICLYQEVHYVLIQ